MANSSRYISSSRRNIKWATAFMIALPVCVFGICLLLQKKSQEISFSDPSLAFAAYSDNKEGGASTCMRLPGRSLNFETILKKGAPFPYAGLAIYHVQPGFFSLSASLLEMDITVGEEALIPVTLMLPADKKLQTMMSDSVVFLQALVHASAGSNTYNLPVSAFQLPEWWLAKHRLNVADVPPMDLNNTISISFQSSPFQQMDKAYLIGINRLGIKNDPWPLQKGMMVGSSLYYLILLAVLFYSSRKEKIQYVPIYPTERTLHEDPLEKIKEVMASCFHLEDVTVEKVAAESGVPAYKIPTLLQEHMGMNFKKFLNLIRVEEAKRLLQDPGIRISEIAYAVGYQHVQHFNRTFKEATSLTPKEFRLKLPVLQEQKD